MSAVWYTHYSHNKILQLETMRDQVLFTETQVIMENTYLMGSKKYHFLGPSVFKFKEPNNEINLSSFILAQLSRAQINTMQLKKGFHKRAEIRILFTRVAEFLRFFNLSNFATLLRDGFLKRHIRSAIFPTSYSKTL